MAGTAKPIEAGSEASYTVITDNTHSSVPKTNPPKFLDGIENATFPNVLYFNSTEQYVELELHEKCNIWRHTATGGEVKHRNPLIIKKLVNGSYIDVTSTVEQHEIEADIVKWTKFISKIPSGTYRFHMNPTPPPATGGIGYTSTRADSEWFIEKNINKNLVIKNPTTNQYYSLAEKTLINLPDASPETMINYGISSDDGITISQQFINKNYILSPNEGNTGGVFEQQISRKPLTISSTNKLAIKHDGTYYTSTDGSTLTPLANESEVETLGFNSLTLSQDIYNLAGVNPTVVAFSNTEDDITIETTTEPFTLYDEFGDEVEVLFYTDDDTVTDADLILEANWSPVDELDGNFEVVTWTDETDSTRTLEMSAIPKPQLIRKTTVSDIGGTLSGIIASTSSPNARFLLTNNNSTWYKWDGTTFKNVTYAKVDDILTLGNTYDELANADYSKWTHSKINIGAFLKDDDTTTSKVNELGIITNSPINTSQVSDLNFYILNTTAKIELDLKGLWLSGQLSDLDLTRVQYRVFLNEQPYYPLSGQFTNLDNPPLNIDITFKSEEIKINDWNTLRVEFKDSFGTVDYWQTTFVGNYSSLMFADTDGNYYSDDVGKVLQYLDFGTFFGGQYTLEHEVVVKNQYGYDVNNLTIEASTGHLPEGVEVQFSDTKDPFIPQANLLLPNELKHEEEVSFYIRMISDIDSVPNGENKFNIFVKAERKV